MAARRLKEYIRISLSELHGLGLLANDKEIEINLDVGYETRNIMRLHFKLKGHGLLSKGCLIVTFNRSERLVQQEIQMVQKSSNLKTGGGIWFFLCPYIGKRCRNLYLDHGWLKCREALNGALYENQIWPKKQRPFFRRQEKEAKLRSIEFTWLLQKGVRRIHAGRATKQMRKYLTLKEELNQTSQFRLPE